MQAYSLDLRERVVAAYEKGEGSLAEIAQRFCVGPTFLKKMLRQKRHTASLERLPQRARAKKLLSASQRDWLAKQVKENPDLTLAELQEDLLNKKKLSVSLPTLCRELQALRLPRKKVTRRQRTKPTKTRLVLAESEKSGARAPEIS
jgi:transposase